MCFFAWHGSLFDDYIKIPRYVTSSCLLQTFLARVLARAIEEGTIFPLQLATALANLGSGNIAGAATAIHLGGPGAAFGCG